MMYQNNARVRNGGGTRVVGLWAAATVTEDLLSYRSINEESD